MTHWGRSPSRRRPESRSPSSDERSGVSPGLTVAIHEALAVHAHLNLTGKVLQESAQPHGLGGFCDVYRGLSLAHGMCVAIKRFRVHMHRDRSFVKSFSRELHIWSKLHHPNVLPLLGYTIDDGVYPALISEWMSYGTVIQYLEKHPAANISDMVRGIAAGLVYLHAKGIVHSDLKSDNVLVSTSGTPLLSDFGVSRLIIETISGESKSNPRGSVRWMAIELFSLEPNTGGSSGQRKSLQSEQADVWAFGMTVYELLTRQRPYAYLPSDFHVIFAIVQGHLPSPPESIEAGTAEANEKILWNLCTRCWQKKPGLRPKMLDVFHELGYERNAVNFNRADERRYFSPSWKTNPMALDYVGIRMEAFRGARADDAGQEETPSWVTSPPLSQQQLVLQTNGLFVKRPREAYAQPKPMVKERGLLAKKLDPDLQEAERKLSFKQQVGICDIFAPSAKEWAWRRTAKKSEVAMPMSTPVSTDSAGKLSCADNLLLEDNEGPGGTQNTCELPEEKASTLSPHPRPRSDDTQRLSRKDREIDFQVIRMLSRIILRAHRDSQRARVYAAGEVDTSSQPTQLQVCSTPRTTRRNMVQEEVSVSLRNNLFWERQVARQAGLSAAKHPPRVPPAQRVEGFAPSGPTLHANAVRCRSGAVDPAIFGPAAVASSPDSSLNFGASIGWQRRWADEYHSSGW